MALSILTTLLGIFLTFPFVMSPNGKQTSEMIMGAWIIVSLKSKVSYLYMDSGLLYSM